MASELQPNRCFCGLEPSRRSADTLVIPMCANQGPRQDFQKSKKLKIQREELSKGWNWV